MYASVGASGLRVREMWREWVHFFFCFCNEEATLKFLCMLALASHKPFRTLKPTEGCIRARIVKGCLGGLRIMFARGTHLPRQDRPARLVCCAVPPRCLEAIQRSSRDRSNVLGNAFYSFIKLLRGFYSRTQPSNLRLCVDALRRIESRSGTLTRTAA